MYYSDEQTEKRIKKLTKRIKMVYRTAYKDVKKFAEDYFKELDERYAREFEKYLAGDYTHEQFIDWYYTQVTRGVGYERMRDILARRVVDANVTAAEYINGETPSVYAENFNYEAYLISEAYGGVSFQIYDEDAVMNILNNESNVTEFKRTRVDKARDYEWNTKQIQNAVVSAILMGMTVDELADSFMGVMKRNEVSAYRNAITAINSAQNAGRQASYERARERGIEIKKEWIATHDEKTRLSHAMLDGKRVKSSERFPNGLMYPSDATGAPAEVYNCRCTMRAILPNVNEEERRTYADWIKEMKTTQNVPTPKQMQKRKAIDKAIERWDAR